MSLAEELGLERKMGVTVLADGSLLVADDAGNTVWRVRASSRRQPSGNGSRASR